MQKADSALDEALAQSFPASDPLPMSPGPALAAESKRVENIGDQSLVSFTRSTPVELEFVQPEK